MTKVLVTGASGFIGSGLIRELNRSRPDAQAFALMRRTSSSDFLKELNYTRVDGDLANVESLKKAVEGIDVVFHLAGATAAPNREAFFEHNASGAGRIAKAAADAGVKKFVLVSSLAAGGPADYLGWDPTAGARPSAAPPRTEMDPDAPVSAYGESKLAGEEEVLRHRDRLSIAILRPPMVYGPRDKSMFLFVQTAARGLVPRFSAVSHDGKKHYSAVHSEDLCRLIVLAGFTPTAADGSGILRSGEIYYASDDDVFSYDQLMSYLASLLGKKKWMIPVPLNVLAGIARSLDVIGHATGKSFPLSVDKMNEIKPDYWICLNAKAKRVLGFKPQFGFESGWKDAVRWYREQGWIR